MSNGFSNKDAGASAISCADSVYIFPAKKRLEKRIEETPRESGRKRRTDQTIYAGVRKAHSLFGANQGQIKMNDWWNNGADNSKRSTKKQEADSKKVEDKAKAAKDRVEQSLKELEDMLSETPRLR